MTRFYTNCFQHGNLIYWTGYEDGKRVSRKEKYEPYLFLPVKEVDGKAAYHTLAGQPVGQKNFGSMGEANKFLKEHKEISNFEVYGNANFLYVWINDHFEGRIEYDSNLINVIFLDIEVESDKGMPDYRNAVHPVNAITISKNKKKITFGCKDYTPKSKSSVYVKCKNEVELLKKFLIIWNNPDYSPDVLTGWHIEGFDIPYLYNRIKVLLGEDYAKKLSPWGIVEEKEINFRFQGKKEIFYELKGVSTLDYLHLYKKFSFKNHESYSLDFISSVELGEKKTDYSQYESLLRLYEENPEMFYDYNIRDVELVEKLDEKLKLLEQVFALAYDAKVVYQDTLATVRMWDTMIHNYLLERYIVVPQPTKNTDTQIVGAYVKDPKIGMYEWVVSFDVRSEYPSLIQQYNIGPETYVGKLDGKWLIAGGLISPMTYDRLKEQDLCITANLCLYRRDKQSFLAALMERIFEDRDKYKKLMIETKKEYERTKDETLKNKIAQYHYLQMAKKIQMNSGYGAVVNAYFRFFSHDNGEAITSSGQMVVKWVEDHLNRQFRKIFNNDKDYVIYADTDSVYVAFDDIVKAKWKGLSRDEIVSNIDKLCKSQIQPYIAKSLEALAEYTNARVNKMEMNREAIAERGIWTAKKRYILKMWDQEGVRFNEPQLKLTGIESVRSSTPAACRTAIKETLNVIMNNDEQAVQEYIRNFKEKFKTLPVSEIAFPRSISGLENYRDDARIYGKSTPIQVKGALIYNRLIRELQLDSMYPYLYNGDKIKFVYLKEPNPLHEHVISFDKAIPKKFGIDEYIDYDKQFEKSYLAPITTVMEAIGWKAEHVATLEEFMM